MPYFVFSCLLRATPKNPHFPELKGAHSVTWVLADSLEKARVRVFDLYLDSEWLLENIEQEQEASLELHPRNRKDVHSMDGTMQVAQVVLYERLINKGISAEIFPFRGEKIE